jgi:hypothetical protein
MPVRDGLHQLTSDSYSHTETTEDQKNELREDRKGAGGITLMAVALWSLLGNPTVREHLSIVAVAILGCGALYALSLQQRKFEI